MAGPGSAPLHGEAISGAPAAIVAISESARTDDVAQAAPRGLLRQSRCGWCALAGRHPDLVEDLHVRHMERGLGSRVLAQIARRRLSAIGEEAPSARSLSRHLRRHVDRALFAIADAVDREPAGRRRGVEFDELWHLHRRLVRQLDAVEAAMRSEDGDPDSHRQAVFVGLSNAARGVLEAVARARGSEAMTIGTAQRAIEAALTRFSAALGEELTDVMELAEASPGADAVVERLREVGAGVGQIASEAAEAALADTLTWARVGDGEP